MTFRARVLSLALLACVVAVSSALAGGDTKRSTVTSTLDGRRVLPQRIHWIAQLHHIRPNQVDEVDFFIDGKKAWDEHQPPYYYGGYSGQLPTDAPWHGGNWLVTSFLTPGMHTFSVRVLRLTGVPVTDTVTARVIAAPASPANLAGAWTRIVTADDVKKAPGTPTGPWTITVNSVGWATGPGDNFDVRYLPNGNVVMGPEVVTPTQQSGAFCGVDPPHAWAVALSADDQRMQLNPVGDDNCGGRVAVMRGIWTRVH